MALRNSSDNNSSEYGFKNMPQPQKVAVISLSVIGVAIIFFGVLQFRARVNNPFQYNIISSSTPDTSVSLMDKDSDQDGLSDYDEANIYQTSRYLEDTDSDGLLDQDEVSKGTDPNCPIGQNCQGGQGFVATTGSTTTDIVSSDAESLGNINISSSTSETELRSALAGEVDIQTLRKLLIEGGASQETLDQVSDEDLLKSYQEVLNKQNE